MYAAIRETIIRLTELIVLTGLILHILPGEQYQKYIKLLIGIVMTAFLLDTGGQFSSFKNFLRFDITENYKEKLNRESTDYDKVEKSQYLCVLSTYENKIKEKLNKTEFPSGKHVKSVKVNICEDVDNVHYGKIDSIIITLTENVDKSVNILVDNIIIGNIDKKSENSENNAVAAMIADELQIDREVIQVVCD